MSYNSQTLKTDNSGTKTFVTGSQYTTYVPGDETIGFLDTSVDKDNEGYGLYFISIIDKDSMTDILYKSSDTVTSQNESATGMANQLGKELYANTKTIPNGAVYTYKNTSLKTNDSTTGVKGHIFTDYESMIKFIYDRVGAEFPEISDLYNYNISRVLMEDIPSIYDFIIKNNIDLKCHLTSNSIEEKVNEALYCRGELFLKIKIYSPSNDPYDFIILILDF